MRLGLLLLVVSATLGARHAEACSCRAIRAEEALQSAAVVAEGLVTLSGTPGRATFSVTASTKGATVGERLEVRWTDPDGFSCFTVKLTAGRWRLYLNRQGPELWIGRCDQHTRRLGPAPETAAPTRLSQEAALALATRAANDALLAAWKRRPDPLTQAPAAFVRAGEAKLEGADASGWRYAWSRFPPAGFSVEASVFVSPLGEVIVTKSHVAFSPD